MNQKWKFHSEIVWEHSFWAYFNAGIWLMNFTQLDNFFKLKKVFFDRKLPNINFRVTKSIIQVIQSEICGVYLIKYELNFRMELFIMDHSAINCWQFDIIMHKKQWWSVNTCFLDEMLRFAKRQKIKGFFLFINVFISQTFSSFLAIKSLFYK